MKKILFSVDSLNFRGTSQAVLDYAKYNQSILGNESIVTYNSTSSYEVDMGNELKAIQDFPKDIKLIANTDNIQSIIDDEKIDIFYKIGSGAPLSKQYSIKTAYHAVFPFQCKDITAYVSEWLSKSQTDEVVPYVSHIVELPEPTKSYREFFDIPKNAIVVGRHGGFKTFDIKFAREAVIKSLEDENVWYLFLNTACFIKHPRVIHIGSVTDRLKLSNFINTCDVMLHARSRGETFGLSICEFLYHNKPVFAWNGGSDKNHIELLKKYDLLYNNTNDIIDMIHNVKLYEKDYRSLIVDSYKAVNVMNQFNDVFIEV